MRNASSAMSCVAEPKATTRAKTTRACRSCCGSVSAMPARPPITANCDSSNQLRRRPSQCVSPGRGMRSTRGAQAHPGQVADGGAVNPRLAQAKAQGTEHQQQGQAGREAQCQHAQAGGLQVDLQGLQP